MCVSFISDVATGAADAIGIKKPLDDAKKSIDHTLTQAADAVGIKKPLDDAVNSAGEFIRDPSGTLSDGITNLSDSLGVKEFLDGPKMPKMAAPPILPETPRSPLGKDITSVKEIDKRRRRILAGKSKNTTFLTGVRGDTSNPNTLIKTLLGE